MSKDSKIVFGIVREVSNKYEKQFRGLKFAGISESAPGGKYRNIGISFDYYGKISKDKARKILVESSTELLEKINANVELRPYLKNYPFTRDDVTISIFVNKPDGKRIYYPEFSVFSFEKEKLRYKYNYKENSSIPTYDLIEEESYEEARQILEQQK